MNRTSTDGKRCCQVHEKCNMTKEDPTLVLIGGYRGDVGPTQSFKTFRNYEHTKKYFKSSDWWRNALIYIYIYWGIRELSIDMLSKLSKRQPYCRSMTTKKNIMSTKRRLMSTNKVPNVHVFSFHFAAGIHNFPDILATSCPHICFQFWQQKSTYSGILAANCPHIGV